MGADRSALQILPWLSKHKAEEETDLYAYWTPVIVYPVDIIWNKLNVAFNQRGHSPLMRISVSFILPLLRYSYLYYLVYSSKYGLDKSNNSGAQNKSMCWLCGCFRSCSSCGWYNSSLIHPKQHKATCAPCEIRKQQIGVKLEQHHSFTKTLCAENVNN